MKTCVRCVLPETFPGVRFDDSGVCNFCRQAPSRERLAEQRGKIRAEFEATIGEIKGSSAYDCLMSWSGGKDSTYTLGLLVRQYGLRVLAFTFDNGFVSETTFGNMRRAADALGVDHTVVKPSFGLLRRIFVSSLDDGLYPKRALGRASAICTSCMGLAKAAALRLAVEKDIPLVAFGWSPGQIPLASAFYKTEPAMVRAMMEATLRPLHAIAGDAVRPYFLEDAHFAKGRFPYFASPLAFFEYDEERILGRIAALGWRRPTDTDPNSTNCLLNALGNAVHKERLSFHPYAAELSGLVREGRLSREEGLARLDAPESPAVLQLVKERLGLDRV